MSNHRDLVSIITVTYNSSKSIGDTLRSIREKMTIPYEVIVVDNNSSDSTLESINKSGIKCKLIKNSQNLGFAKANNIAVDAARGEYLFFLNPDTCLMDDIRQALEYLVINENVGMVGLHLVDDNGKTQPSVRKLPSLYGAIREYILGKKYEYEHFVPNASRPVEVESVVGAAVLMSKNIYKQVGGFNDEYFLYYEDLDLCRQTLKSGFKIVYFPSVKVRHTIGVSSRSNPKSYGYLQQSARIYHGPITYLLITFILKIRRFFPAGGV